MGDQRIVIQLGGALQIKHTAFDALNELLPELEGRSEYTLGLRIEAVEEGFLRIAMETGQVLKAVQPRVRFRRRRILEA